jgi:hypothetical protein
MRRLFLSFAVLALSLISVGIVPQHSVAAPLPPPPVLSTPADGSTSTDTTPTFTGTAVPGAKVDILVDGNLIGTSTADPDGNFSFTPGMSLAPGKHQAAARARANGVTSGPSTSTTSSST